MLKLMRDILGNIYTPSIYLDPNMCNSSGNLFENKLDTSIKLRE